MDAGIFAGLAEDEADACIVKLYVCTCEIRDETRNADLLWKGQWCCLSSLEVSPEMLTLHSRFGSVFAGIVQGVSEEAALFERRASLWRLLVHRKAWHAMAHLSQEVLPRCLESFDLLSSVSGSSWSPIPSWLRFSNVQEAKRFG